MIEDKRYINHRKKGLKEERKLIYERDVINRSLRKIRKELAAWDNALLDD